MSMELFLSPRLTGARFEGHAIPLEFLKDLAVLEELITEVAKAEFLKDHKDRQRSPRGFTEGIELKLTSIDEGSAILKICLVVASVSGTLFPPENRVYYEKAREAIVGAISAAEQKKTITELPDKNLAYFDRIGRSLRDGEAIEFSLPMSGTVAKLTKETRRRLILASESVNELTEEIVVRGAISEANQDLLSFELLLIDGRKIKAPISAPHRDTIFKAFNEYLEGVRVLLKGVGIFNRNDHLLKIDSIEHISILDPLDVSARLEELKSLKDGWLDGHGIAPSKEGLDWLSLAFTQFFLDDLPFPYLYPTEDGGIRVEWSLEAFEVSIDIDLSTHVGLWHSIKNGENTVEEKQLKLGDSTEWVWLCKRIQEMSGGC